MKHNSHQSSMFVDHLPPMTEGIDLRYCSVETLLDSGVSGVRLVSADPPWEYDDKRIAMRDMGDDYNGQSIAHYASSSIATIVDILDRAFDCCATDAYMICFTTWPKIMEFLLEMQRSRWRNVTGGSWHKTGGIGIGYHVRGDSEPWLLFLKGKPRPTGTLSNAFASPRGKHSEKPVEFWKRVFEAMTEPGDLVLSVYSGMCPEARAAKATGRKLVGAEIDKDRHRMAIGLLAGYNTQHME